MDRCEIVALDAKLKTPAGTFKECLRAKETSALEKGSSYKLYAPGVGLIKDAECLLVKIVQTDASKRTVQANEVGVRLAPANCPACAMGLSAEFVFDRLDVDKNKIVTAKEFSASPGMQNLAAAGMAVERIDKDGDSTLCWQEFEEAYKARHADCKPVAPAKGGRPDGRGNVTMFARVFMLRNDRNGDGRVDKSEFVGAEMGFNRLDQNKNGYIEVAELGVLHQSRLNDPKSMRERLEGGDQHNPL